MKTALKIMAGCSVLFIAVILYFSRVPVPEEKECLAITGIVTYVNEGGAKDAVFSLDTSDTLFYINRGLENGFTLDSLQKELMGKQITIKYPDYTSLLPSAGAIKNISKLYHGNKVVYSEID